MHKRTITILAVLAGVVLLGATAASAGERAAASRRARGLKALGLKVYWSLLREDQKADAKAVLADFLTDTAPDRLSAAARLLRFKADVAAVLTPEQRREAARMKRASQGLAGDERRAVLDRLLEGTDREALAARVERLAGAAPQAKVMTGLEILDQLYDVAEPAIAERLGLSPEQRERIRALYVGLKSDLTPVAVRLETAKAAATAKAVALLDDAQRTKLEQARESIAEKVLAFLRG